MVADPLIKSSAAEIASLLSGSGGIGTPLYNATSPDAGGVNDPIPKAYLTVLFFDERFNFIGEGSATDRVDAPGNGSDRVLVIDPVKAPRNGYAFVYLSNESDEHVYFDNLKVQLRHGHIIEENHYYAYGLKIAGISSRKMGDAREGQLNNPYQYQGDYSEFDDETGWNDFALRSYDPQTGRFINADPYDQFASGYVGMGNDPVNNIDPSGGWVFSAIPLIEHGAWAIGGAVAGMVISGASSGWDITAMKQGAGIGFGVGLGASFVNWGNVGGLLQGGSSVPWILYNGTKVIIYEGKEGSTKKSKVITESNGTSGSTNHQFADEQFDRNPIYPGPVPEGNYKIDLTLDPNRKVVFDPESGAANRDRGIQQIPHFTQRNDGNKQNNWDVWGTVRARLEKDPGNNDPRMRGENDGYYLHDSDKGNTHGCIECSKKKIFDQLLKYRAEGIKSIRVKVKYPKPKTFTNGGPHGK